MVADSLLNRLGNCNCFVQGFADDVVILISAKFPSSFCDFSPLGLEIGLNVNADKTKRRNLEGFFAPKLFD
jgi:hypothetical protein